MQGDFGKPGPALVIQSDAFADTATVSVLLISSMLVDAPLLRVTLEPTLENGLCAPSGIMIDETMTVRRQRLGGAIGRLDAETMLAVNRLLALFFGFGR